MARRVHVNWAFSESSSMRRRCTVESAFAHRNVDQGGFFNLPASVLVLCGLAGCSVLSATLFGFFCPQPSSRVCQRTLSLSERVAYQRAIEDVYWHHRIWPTARLGSKPSLDAVMSHAQLEKKVEDYLRNSQALESYWRWPITAEQLQAEMDRMAKNTKQPEVLRELFAALGNDPFVIAECLARQVLVERSMADLSPQDRTRRFEPARTKGLSSMSFATTLKNMANTVPKISEGTPPCTDDSWTATSTTNAPRERSSHTAVWTGSEMIVWGGFLNGFPWDTGGRYDPGTDSWTATSTINAPSAREFHTAIWTGAEMIVWGGWNGTTYFNSGGRYNPTTDSWEATSTANAGTAREEPHGSLDEQRDGGLGRV
jgi:hypothetical protein